MTARCSRCALDSGLDTARNPRPAGPRPATRTARGTAAPRAATARSLPCGDRSRRRGRTCPGAQGRAQGLASLPEGRVHHLEDLRPGRSSRRRWAMVHGDEARVDSGRRPEHGAADGSCPPYLAVPLGLDRRDAVRATAGWGREPIGDLRLHHDQRSPQRGQQLPQMEKHRHRNVVGQVRDECSGLRSRDLGHPECIRCQDIESVDQARCTFSTVWGSAAARTGSISMATTRAGLRKQAKGQ